MPVFLVKMIPRGSWEALIGAPNKQLAEGVADEHFDTSARLSDAGWEVESVTEVSGEPEFVYEDEYDPDTEEDDPDNEESGGSTDSSGDCSHASAMPRFSTKELLAAAENLSTPELRKRFPRFAGTCPDCGEYVFLYASTVHYIAGDW